MDQRPIGVFDSGFGGLTAVRRLRQSLPREHIIYFGDAARVPYGNRSRDTILKYARQDMAFLRTFSPKAVLIACGTVSTTALETLAAENTIPSFGVVDPAARAAAEAPRTGQIGLGGTQASIRTGAYERAIAACRPETEVLARACPLFVPLVENGRFKPGDRVAELVAAEYLEPLKAAGVDTLVLGCTHYPLLAQVIGNYMGPDVKLINTGAACAKQAAADLAARDALAEGRAGEHRYYVSDSVDDFARLASVFLGEDVRGGVEQVDIPRY